MYLKTSRWKSAFVVVVVVVVVVTDKDITTLVDKIVPENTKNSKCCTVNVFDLCTAQQKYV